VQLCYLHNILTPTCCTVFSFANYCWLLLWHVLASAVACLLWSCKFLDVCSSCINLCGKDSTYM